METTEEKKPEETIAEENTESIEATLEQVEEKPEEEKVAEEDAKPTYEELEERITENQKLIEEAKARIAELEALVEKLETVEEDKETVSKEECEKRVSGMQAKMQSQVNDFRNELKLKDNELTEANAKITSLVSELENANRELSLKTSALEDRTNALATLNAGVNSRPMESDKPSGWGSLDGEDFFNYLKKHNGILTIKNK